MSVLPLILGVLVGIVIFMVIDYLISSNKGD